MSKLSLQSQISEIAKEHLLKENIPIEIIDIILKMVYGPLSWHFKKELESVFLFLVQGRGSVKDRNKFWHTGRYSCPQRTCMRTNMNWISFNNPEYYNKISVACNCCKRHQINKAEIDHVNKNYRIITKSIVNKSDFPFKGCYRVSDESRGKFRYENYGGIKGNCPCNCRAVSRHSVRRYMKNMYGKDALDGREDLGITKSSKLLKVESTIDSLSSQEL
jgi:hypothetical protein